MFIEVKREQDQDYVNVDQIVRIHPLGPALCELIFMNDQFVHVHESAEDVYDRISRAIKEEKKK